MIPTPIMYYGQWIEEHNNCFSVEKTLIEKFSGRYSKFTGGIIFRHWLKIHHPSKVVSDTDFYIDHPTERFEETDRRYFTDNDCIHKDILVTRLWYNKKCPTATLVDLLMERGSFSHKYLKKINNKPHQFTLG
jgi:hypothetical protein